jgi:hypothetical protein
MDWRPSFATVFKNAQITPAKMCSNVNGKVKTAYAGEALGVGSVGSK